MDKMNCLQFDEVAMSTEAHNIKFVMSTLMVNGISIK